jgi:hypothetical protein
MRTSAKPDGLILLRVLYLLIKRWCACVFLCVCVHMCLFFEHGAGLNLTPANQAPVLFNSSGERNLFANLGAHRAR